MKSEMRLDGHIGISRRIASLLIIAVTVSDMVAAQSPAEEKPTPEASVSSIEAGRSELNQRCAKCHGPDANTVVRQLNLRRLQLRYGADWQDKFAQTVKAGRLSKGMPSWDGSIDEATIKKIAAFIASVQISD